MFRRLLLRRFLKIFQDFQKSLRSCALDESSLSIKGRVNLKLFANVLYIQTKESSRRVWVMS